MMKNLNKWYIVGILLLIFILIFSYFNKYYNKYSIKDSNEGYLDYLKKEKYIGNSFTIVKQTSINNIKIMILKSNKNELRFAEFKKGINGKYSFLSIGSMGNIECFVVNLEGKYYLLAMGYNSQNNLLKINLLSNSKHKLCTFNIKDEAYFIKYVNAEKNEGVINFETYK